MGNVETTSVHHKLEHDISTLYWLLPHELDIHIASHWEKLIVIQFCANFPIKAAHMILDVLKKLSHNARIIG